jgi:hypothetical protein
MELVIFRIQKFREVLHLMLVSLVERNVDQLQKPLGDPTFLEQLTKGKLVPVWLQ